MLFDELLTLILLNLGVVDFVRVQLVNKQFHSVVTSVYFQSLWPNRKLLYKIRRRKNINDRMAMAAKHGDKYSVDFFITKGASYWDMGMAYAAGHNHLTLVQFFIKKGAKRWNLGMAAAAGNNHLTLVQFFIEKGAKLWRLAMNHAARGGYVALVELFRAKIIEERPQY